MSDHAVGSVDVVVEMKEVKETCITEKEEREKAEIEVKEVRRT